MMDEKDIEKMIKNSRFSNQGHKKALHGRLLDETEPLNLNDLEMVAGGITFAEQEQWEIWPEPEKNGK